jgi:hypothetical protein
MAAGGQLNEHGFQEADGARFLFFAAFAAQQRKRKKHGFRKRVNLW